MSIRWWYWCSQDVSSVCGLLAVCACIISMSLVSRGRVATHEETNRQQLTIRKDTLAHRDDAIDLGHVPQICFIVVSKYRAERHVLIAGAAMSLQASVLQRPAQRERGVDLCRVSTRFARNYSTFDRIAGCSLRTGIADACRCARVKRVSEYKVALMQRTHTASLHGRLSSYV